MDKAYIFNTDDPKAPTPWMDFTKDMNEADIGALFEVQRVALVDWFIEMFPGLDDEDRRYALRLFYLMGCPFWKYEAINLLVVMKTTI